MTRIAIASVLLLFTVMAHAQASSTSLGNTKLTLGAGQSSVMSRLRSRFTIKQDGDRVQVYPHADTTGPLGAPVGAVHFANGKLVEVTRYLGTIEGPQAADAARRLISSFNAAGQAGKPNPDINTDYSHSGGPGISRVVFNLSDRQVEIAVFQPNKPGAPDSVILSEHYQLPPQAAASPREQSQAP